jgi:hypothetical protein
MALTLKFADLIIKVVLDVRAPDNESDAQIKVKQVDFYMFTNAVYTLDATYHMK